MAGEILETHIAGLRLAFRGKVRDVYDLGDALLIVATDRLSAFDVVLPTPIPEKGRVLSTLSRFWFERTRHIVPNHLLDRPLEDVVPAADAEALRSRSQVVCKAKPLPIEAVVRGYLAGSGWKEYKKSQTVCGIKLPSGLQDSSELPEPIFTPATKAETGHDENIDFATASKIVGREIAERVRDISISIYSLAREYARKRGIIIADTKFEFGTFDGKLILIDEVLTPDSSRFWPADQYAPGKGQPSFDKQFVRDYLEAIKWNKQPPVPSLPDEVIMKTREKYVEAYRRLTGRDLA